MQPEFSKIIDTDKLDEDVQIEKITASASERKALAKRFKIVAINSFSATIALNRETNGDVKVTGDIAANVTLNSIISLEDFETDIKDSFKVIFTHSFKEDDGNIDINEDIEPLIGSKIDIGELASEYLALAIPPFPKKEGEKFAYKAIEPINEQDNDSPFAVLKSLK